MRVEIIDDDYGDVRQVQDGLMDLDVVTSAGGVYGYEAACDLVKHCASDGALAFPDVIVIEAMLNNGSAPNIISNFRRIKGTSSTSILVYTNTDDQAVTDACMAAGANEVFPKGPGTAGLDALVEYVGKLEK